MGDSPCGIKGKPTKLPHSPLQGSALLPGATPCLAPTARPGLQGPPRGNELAWEPMPASTALPWSTARTAEAARPSRLGHGSVCSAW